MATALVVGGAGFIGRNLVEELVAKGDRCLVVDNYSGLGAARPMPAHVEMIRASASAIDQLELGQVDSVYYLAARVGGVAYNQSHQSEMLLRNLEALAGLHHCYSLGPRVLVYFSTACVYPAEAPVPTTEEWGHKGHPEGTNLGYGIAKRAGEALVEVLYRETGIPTVIARPFNAFGPWDLFDVERGHFVPSILLKMLQNRPRVDIWGGKQTRAFVFVRDLVHCVIRLAASATEFRAVNVGHRGELSIREAAHIVAEVSSYRGELCFVEGIEGYLRRAADSSQLESLIGPITWTPFARGIEETVEWCWHHGVENLG